MSILGPFDESGPSEKPKEDDQLLVFGYACKLFRDETKALLESSGQLLIPWMGDNSLMVDRYDARNRLEDKSLFGVKSNLPYKMSSKERQLEEELDRERYLALQCDDIRVEEQEEEEKRRASENSLYSAIGFSYSEQQVEGPPPKPKSPPPVKRVESPPSTEEGEEFVLPPGLVVPEGINLPVSKKLHSIVQKTAMFVCQQGLQMEIIIKTKQQLNPLFSFLNMQDPLHPYYTHIKTVLANRSYVPRLETAETDKPLEIEAKEVATNDEKEAEKEAEKENNSSDNVTVADSEKSNESPSDQDSDSDSDDGGYLHPLLMQTTKPRSKSPTPTVPTTKETTPPPHQDVPTLSAFTFRAKTMVVNAAPILREKTVAVETPPVSSVPATITNGNSYGSYAYAGPPTHYIESHPLYQDGGGYPPPPPHEAHYPPPPQEAHYPPPLHTMPTDGYNYPYDAYYASSYQPPPPSTTPLPPPDLRSIIDKTAAYVAKNGDSFEATVIKRHIDDPRFCFLNPWGEYYGYYRQQRMNYSYYQVPDIQEQGYDMPNLVPAEKPSVQKLNSSGAVSFKVQSKSQKLVSDDGQFVEPVVEDSSEPSVKKPRLDNVSSGKIGSTVQEFLYTVKEMFQT